MADINASLKEALNGKAPQHKKKGQSTFEFSEGSDGSLHTKVTDENGYPIDPRKVELPNDFPDSAVKTELEQIKQQQADILARLDQPVETQLTGRKVEKITEHTINYDQISMHFDSTNLGKDGWYEYIAPPENAINISNHKNLSIAIYNNLDVAMTTNEGGLFGLHIGDDVARISQINRYGTTNAGDFVNIPAGSRFVLTPYDCVEFKEGRYIYFTIRYKIESPTSGYIRTIMTGEVI